ncbi:MAG TPA: toll/interleukin-1 receptor domain-containing protein [Longimicrobium sp.]|nr:toll/interleukin-1 receptor domain-containing protein [Longimicrobium sp.]
MADARDVFLCHAHADKDTIVRPLAAALRSFGVTCWLDEAEILIGDPITSRINEGLAISSYVVAIVTENFLGRSWPRVELQSALSAEAASGVVRVLPLVSVPHETFCEHFPLLRDKLYLRWNGDAPAMAKAIAERIGVDFTEHHTAFLPVDYTGQIWIRFLQLGQHVGRTHHYTLRWGNWRCEGSFDSALPAVCLVTSKGPDTFPVPLITTVAPACNIATGTGPPPCPRPMDINFRWRRVRQT